MIKPLADRIVIKVMKIPSRLQAEYLFLTVQKKNRKKARLLLSVWEK